jgi:chromosome partitioning protein
MGLIISVVNQKGGVGKSTLTQALASALALLHQKKVLVIDTDPQRTSVKWYARRCDEGAEPGMAVISVDVAGAIESNATSQAGTHDYVFVEGGAGVSATTAAAIRAAHVVLIPVQAAWKDFESTADTVALVKQRQALTGGAPAAYFIVTQSDKKEKITRDITEALLEYGFPVLDSQLTERSTHRLADLASRTALEYRPRSKAADDIRAILNELIAEKVI